MALATAKMVTAALLTIERALELKKKRRMAAIEDANISESTYYRWREGAFSPTVETLYRLAQFADLPFGLTVGAYTSATTKGGPDVTPRLAEIAAALGELSEEDQERVVRMVQRFAALRSEPSEPPPARAGSRVAKAR